VFIFEEKVLNVVNSCQEGTIFLAAVSGGADSMVMLAALCEVVPKEKIFCIHVEHGIRPAQESRGDAEHVRRFCGAAGVSCKVVSVAQGRIAAYAKKHGTGIEAAARSFRRKALFGEARRLGKNTRILIAHTNDDMLETSLMRVLRGAGPSGLAALPQVRGRILRPLLSLTKAEVIAYLTQKNVSWREDSTNDDDNFLRNRIRRRLISMLDESFPSWRSGIVGMAQTQSLAADFLVREAENRVLWEWGVGSREQEAKRPCVLSTDAANFFAQPQILREESLFLGLNLFSALIRVNPWTNIKRSTIRHFCEGSSKTVDLGPLRIQQKDGKILISPSKKKPSETGFSLLIKEPGLYNLNNISIKVAPKETEQGNKDGFFAALPLVFRRSFKDDFLVCKGRKIRANAASALISAFDMSGTAAFIKQTEVLFARDMPEEQDFYYIVIGGTGV
jgi:tRNA(Ile)-lysidine synthase